MTALRSRVRRLLLAAGIACCAVTNAAQAQVQPQAAPVLPDTRGFRFQIVTGDDSSVTRRISDDLSKRLVPIFGSFRTGLFLRGLFGPFRL